LNYELESHNDGQEYTNVKVRRWHSHD